MPAPRTTTGALGSRCWRSGKACSLINHAIVRAAWASALSTIRPWRCHAADRRQALPPDEGRIPLASRSPVPAAGAATMSAQHACRSCGEPLRLTMVDLGASPLCERFLRADQLDEMEPFYPLRVEVCESCYLAQVPAYVTPEAIFTDYAYFSSFSDSWLMHARRYADTMVERLDLGPASLVAELGSNDGYLLANFVERGIPVMGIEPAANVAREAEARGVRTLVRFFGRELAEELVASGIRADLIAANNTLAQIPDLN